MNLFFWAHSQFLKVFLNPQTNQPNSFFGENVQLQVRDHHLPQNYTHSIILLLWSLQLDYFKAFLQWFHSRTQSRRQVLGVPMPNIFSEGIVFRLHSSCWKTSVSPSVFVPIRWEDLSIRWPWGNFHLFRSIRPPIDAYSSFLSFQQLVCAWMLYWSYRRLFGIVFHWNNIVLPVWTSSVIQRFLLLFWTSHRFLVLIFLAFSSAWIDLYLPFSCTEKVYS